MGLNRVLTNEDREYYKPLIQKMFDKCPDMMSRKITEANVQQAFGIDTVKQRARKTSPLLCVGSFEDTCNEYLQETGYNVCTIDPQINSDLHTFATLNPELTFNGIFSISVIEHVQDDEEFIKDICGLLAAKGTAVLTMDYNNAYKAGDPLPYSDVRFYTETDLTERLKKIIEENDCYIADEQDYDCEPDFIYQGHRYSFSTLVFRKNA